MGGAQKQKHPTPPTGHGENRGSTRPTPLPFLSLHVPLLASAVRCSTLPCASGQLTNTGPRRPPLLSAAAARAACACPHRHGPYTCFSFHCSFISCMCANANGRPSSRGSLPGRLLVPVHSSRLPCSYESKVKDIVVVQIGVVRRVEPRLVVVSNR